MDANTYLIAGLGNPGREYQFNRHNVGFMVVDALAKKLGVRFTRLESKSLVTKSEYQGQKLILAKPQTYMNLSGQSISSLIRFYKINPSNMLIVYDELDLPFGVIRLRPKGGSAGHRGMQSIIEQIGTQEFPRLRVGIGRPPGRMSGADYVLKDISRQEADELEFALQRAVEAVLVFIALGLEKAMTQFNGAFLEEE